MFKLTGDRIDLAREYRDNPYGIHSPALQAALEQRWLVNPNGKMLLILQPIVGSSLVLGTVLAFTLNLLFRIGVRQRVHLQFDVASGRAGDVDHFLDEHGAKWGARGDIVARASFALHQFAEAIGDHCNVRAPIRTEASFDEFNLDLAMSYEGVPFELPERRPSAAEFQESEDGLRRLTGFMLRQNADLAESEITDELVVVRFHFDH